MGPFAWTRRTQPNSGLIVGAGDAVTLRIAQTLEGASVTPIVVSSRSMSPVIPRRVSRATRKTRAAVPAGIA